MSDPTPPGGRRRWIVWGLVLAGLLVFVGANAHLIYVAFESQPDCVTRKDHSAYRAAKPTC